MKIGFEFEFAAYATWSALRTSLRKEFGSSFDKVFSHYTEDWSVRAPSKSISNRYIAPLPVELITNPLPKRQALSVLNRTLEWMQEFNCITNKTTGLHVNYSDLRVQHKMDPVSVLTTMDYNGILDNFHRKNNKFCYSWDVYLFEIKKRVKREAKKGIKIEASLGTKLIAPEKVFTQSAAKFMYWVGSGYYSRDYVYRDVYNSAAIDIFNNKRVCLNTGYVKRRGYVECRMLGNNYLKLQAEILPSIEMVEAGLLMACDVKYNRKKNNQYLQNFYLT